jgi:hypothetical protein
MLAPRENIDCETRGLLGIRYSEAYLTGERSIKKHNVTMFTDEQLDALINGQPIDEALPFDPRDDNSIRRFYEAVAKKIETTQGLSSRIEWDHYGSGYASFIDAWFYPSDDSSRISFQSEHYTGLFVLLSRLSRYFVIGQGEKSWSRDGGNSYMPCFDLVDIVTHSALIRHVNSITSILADAGMVWLKRKDLVQPLPERFSVTSILSDPPYCHFDALFHWED